MSRLRKTKIPAINIKKHPSAIDNVKISSKKIVPHKIPKIGTQKVTQDETVGPTEVSKRK